MNISKHVLAIPAVFGCFALSACGGGGGGSAPVARTVTTPVYATQSKFVLPTGTGAIYAGLSSVEGGSVIDIEGDGYAYQIGKNPDDAFVAVAGTVVDSSNANGKLPAVAKTGTASYTGSYKLVHLNRDSADDATGVIKENGGAFTLTADLAAGTFTGRSTENTQISATETKNVLYSQGTFTDGVMEGMVRYRQTDKVNIRADMAGVIGANKALGAFQGGDDDIDAIAGGFNLLAD
ncbi:hypothetical protein [Pseudoprimorskyibacter insulae]|uniref:Transferrin-binding protein B C-lobe/N-lobe beta barrel domain-containing protein n=1 Tax=Pseudoprimorskyibacter insulae TaxID=1695997 RepID=A0A2R8AWF6_9RHOB|nr:hypothetical protein [Pseudoprimorskyibacter insulae]SPF80381.1 hypothetical protein PRI8871_02186 [Pseudoprimorskyibacter insulae]